MSRLCFLVPRDFDDFSIIEKAFHESGFRVKVIVGGSNKDLDAKLEIFAEENGLQYEIIPIDWNDLDAEGAVVKTNTWGKEYNAMAPIAQKRNMIDDCDYAVIIDDGSTGVNYDVKAVEEVGIQFFRKDCKPSHLAGASGGKIYKF